ncbi:head GIN domain-containing protein [Leeuwenhoekiella sp. W20_SRS_FM14]|uniref:head GIN domain-containing protein n=1 Tax=Leeuwenhoekiella sp. W20_SRS_FM14 TaxID=3240270 RepID=UPI003F97D6A3
MTTLIKLIIGSLIALVMTSCNFNFDMGQVNGTGNVVTKDLNLSQEFSKIHSSNGWDVVLEKGTTPSVVAEMDENLLEYLDVHFEGNTLRIETTDNSNIGNATSRKIHVTYTQPIEEIKASSASNITATEALTGDRISFDLSSAATVKLPIEIREIVAEASSAATLDLEGEAQTVRFDASSAATINAKDLKSEFCDAEASSAGSIRVYASKEIASKASSAGDIDYWGSPKKVAVIESSGGNISKQ